MDGHMGRQNNCALGRGCRCELKEGRSSIWPVLTFSWCLNDSTPRGSLVWARLLGSGAPATPTCTHAHHLPPEHNEAATDSCWAWEHPGIAAPCSSDTFPETLRVFHASGKYISLPLLKWCGGFLIPVNLLCRKSRDKHAGYLISVCVPRV